MHHFEIPKKLGRVSAIILQDPNTLQPEDFDGTLFGVGIIGMDHPHGFIDMLIMVKLEPDGEDSKEAGHE